MIRTLSRFMLVISLAALPLLLLPARSVAGAKVSATVYATPEDAVRTLVEAVRTEDPARMAAVIGAGSEEWLFSGDKVADREDWLGFLSAYDRKHELRFAEQDWAELVVGENGWTFPAPLVRLDGKWHFDAAAGREEASNRRVGRNELDTIETLLAIVDAQRDYASADLDQNGAADYARRFFSSPGQRDGLFWPVAPGAPASPLGPLLAEAAREGYVHQEGKDPAPYHGYHFRMLTAQGAAAAGGAYDYLVGERMLGGFAVVAYPAKHGVSGVMTFIVNHDGVVFEKDLGPATVEAAGKMTAFNPDQGWVKVSADAGR